MEKTNQSCMTGSQRYNYLRELHRLFNVQAACAEQQTAIEQLKAELKKNLEDRDRRLLLRILDARDVMDYEISLESFAAGFRLAYGLTRELESSGRYSYEDEEVRRICQNASH